jgi:hypothetical protein
MTIGNVLLVAGFLILVGVWLIVYAACCVAGMCDDEEGKR